MASLGGIETLFRGCLDILCNGAEAAGGVLLQAKDCFWGTACRSGTWTCTHPIDGSRQERRAQWQWAIFPPVRLMYCLYFLWTMLLAPRLNWVGFGCSSHSNPGHVRCTPEQTGIALTECRRPGLGAPVAANRGASGIDGVLSTAAGWAEGLERGATLLVGDVSFLHDINGLNLLRTAELRPPLTVGCIPLCDILLFPQAAGIRNNGRLYAAISSHFA